MSKFLKRIVSITMILVMLFGIFPLQRLNFSHAIDLSDGKSIGKIVIGRTYDENLDFQNMYIELYRKSGSIVDISDVVVKYGTSGGGYEALSQKVTSDPYYVKYELTTEEMNDFDGRLMINEKEVTVDFSGVSTVNQIKRIINVDVDEDGNDLNGTQYYFEIMDGNNLDNLFTTDGNGYFYTALFEKSGAIEDVQSSTIIEQTSSTLKIENPNRAGDYGSHNLIFKKSKTDVANDLEIEVRNTYMKVFSFIKNLNIPDLKMYPNIGSRGDLVNFTGTGVQSDYEVYFLKDIEGRDTYNQNNKAQFVNFITNSDGTGTLIVSVPQGLELSEYFVVITDTKNGEIISEKLVTKIVDAEEVPDKFVVIDSNKKASILSVTPISGPDTGQSVVIEGKNISTLNLYDLELIDGYSDYEYTFDYSDPNYLIIKYHESGNPSNTEIWEYKGEPFSIEKRIWVNIGQLQTFENDPILSESLDKLFLNVKLDEVITEETLKDIIVGTETTFTTGGEVKYRFYEDAVLEDGEKYIFQPSKVQPEITDVVPDKIQIEDNKIKLDTLLAIYGKDFAIYRNVNESGEAVVYYPTIRIYDDSKLEIEINPNEGYIKDKNGNIVQDENGSPIVPEIIILDGPNKILDGSDGKQIGNKIIVTLPKGTEISGIGPKDIEITNPIKNDTRAGLSTTENDIFEFVVSSESPTISSVEPNVVTVDGGETVEVIGSNFKEGVKVYIDGIEITNVQREGDGKKLTFTAPPNREGITQLQVVNPDGGTAIYDFIYVETYTDPKITNISPKEGMLGTLVIVDGDNFLKPDPTATYTTELGMYKLIGTRILVDEKEVNEYYKPSGKIELQYFKPSQDNQLISMEEGKVKIADYYHSILLQEVDKDTEQLLDNFYVASNKPDGTIIISDGVEDEYSLSSENDEIKAVKNEGEEVYTLTIEEGVDYSEIQFKDDSDTIVKKLRIRTPYTIGTDEDGKPAITGNRVKVISKNQLYFYFHVDNMAPDGYYDITVINPDTKRYTVEDGFRFYRSPGGKPYIEKIEPSQGSVEGGYYIEITGQNFKGDGESKIRVYIGSIQVDSQDIELSPDNTVIKVKVPPYPGDIREELGVDRKTVPVVVVNYDGGSDYREDGFTYITPTSYPTIERLSKTEGKAAGGEFIQIFGTDFRFYEPFVDANGNARLDWTDTNNDGICQSSEAIEQFTDINNNGIYDNILSKGIVADLTEDEKKVLPKVYFGNNQGEIVEYAEGYILVKTPPGQEGSVGVHIVNNDYGISNSVSFEYRASEPSIFHVVPNEGDKSGGEIIEIHGEDFVESKIEILTEDENGNDILEEKDMVLVRFGLVSEDTNLEDEESGNIISGRSKVTLKGGLNIDYNAMNDTLTVSIDKDDKTYTKTYLGYDDTEKFIDISKLKSSDDSSYYDGQELIRVRVEDKRVIIERGYSPDVTVEYEGKLLVSTPTYHSVKTVPLVVINPDGQESEEQFNYKSPDSQPFITDITPKGPVINKQGDVDYYVVESVIDGGILFTITGGDFRKGVKVFVGTEEAEIISRSNNEDELVVKAPRGREIDLNRPLKITIINEDGGTTDSSQILPPNGPIYYVYREKVTFPVIESITPNTGSAKGGDVIVITGNHFRVEPGHIEVRIGTRTATIDFSESNYDRLVVITPPSDFVGPVDVVVKNTIEMGEAIAENGFTYHSSPEIDNISPDKVFTTGGQTVTITGDMFMEGVRVYIGDGQVGEVTLIDENTIEIITPPGELGFKDVRIENTDGGSFIIEDGLEYIYPVPQDPTGFRAEPGHERSIVLKWDETEGVTRYKIYGRKGTKGDYEFIAETTGHEYYLTGLEPDTKYYFRLWSLNEYGESEGYDYDSARTLEEDEDEGDDKYDEDELTEEKELRINYTNGAATVNLPSEYSYSKYNLNFADSKYKDYKTIQVNIPMSAIKDGDGTLTVTTEEINLYVPMYILKSSTYYYSTNNDDSNVILRISKLDKAEKSRITKGLSRNEEAVSDAYSIELILQISKSNEPIGLNGAVTFGVNVDKDGVDKGGLYMAKYNPDNNELNKYKSSTSLQFDYNKVKDIYNVSCEIRESGKFIVIYKK